jgi:hypothetical protein
VRSLKRMLQYLMSVEISAVEADLIVCPAAEAMVVVKHLESALAM